MAKPSESETANNCYLIKWSSNKKPKSIRSTFIHDVSSPDEALHILHSVKPGRINRIHKVVRDSKSGGKSYS